MPMVRRGSDDGRRGQAGLVLSIRRDATEVELTIDDVTLERSSGVSNSNERLWRHERFVTFLRLPPEMPIDGFSKEQLADFGLTIIGCVYPLANRLSGEPSQNRES
jgi:hypothetical protein